MWCCCVGTARLIVKLGSVTVEAPLEPGALSALRWVFEALGLRLEEGDDIVVLMRGAWKPMGPQ